MKRVLLLVCCAIFALVSCSNQKQEDILQPDEETETEVSIIPSYSLSDDQYKIVLPYRPSVARGAITNQITNRVDINQLEEGLRRQSTEVFDPTKVVYEEGQYLTTGFIYEMIDSLNPDIKALKDSETEDKKKLEKKIKEHRKNPRVFSHILEQNFLKKNESNSADLVGVSIGIALKSVYRFQVETGGPYYYEDIPKDEMLKEGKKIADEVLKEIRQMDKLKEVPILIALFREEEQSSPVPGDFVSKTLVKKGENSIEKWTAIDEEHILFPSDQAKKKYNEDYQKVKTFSEKVANYFPNYVGVAGTGFYIDQNLTRLTMDVPIEFYGEGEVLGFSQYVFGQIKEIFPNHYDIEVSVTSSDGAESLIYRKAGEKEPKVHIYH